MQGNHHPSALRRLAIAAALLLAVGAGSMPATATNTEGDPPAQHPFNEAYALPGAVDASATLARTVSVSGSNAGLDGRGCAYAGATENRAAAEACPMFGVAVCDLDSTVGATAFTRGVTVNGDLVSVEPGAAAAQPSVGGACGDREPRLVRGGDTVTVGVDDASGLPTTFGACVDGNGDDLCRPESAFAAGDTWVMKEASAGPGPLAVQHAGLPGALYVFLFAAADSQPTTGSVWGVVDTATSSLPECADGLDNDGDGDSDGHDLGCATAGDGDERGEAPKALGVSAECLDFATSQSSSYLEQLLVGTCDVALPDVDARKVPECMDRADNDPWPGGSDGADWPADPDCDSPLDDRERGPACSDHIDNDGDGRTDHPSDPGCTSPTDDDEYNPWACSDGIDNDRDGRRDSPNDPGCSGPFDNDESNPWACSDGIDNDGDWRRDYPNDPGCSSPYDNSEWNPAPKN